MDPLIEAVPNFSTSDQQVIAQIVQTIVSIPTVYVLNVESDKDYNRCVITMVGSYETIAEASFNALSVAAKLIDMSEHTGVHPRIGACDVFPFIPLDGKSYEKAIVIAKDLANRVGTELRIPVFLYGKATTSQRRTKLSDIRKGGYEGLHEKLQYSQWLPDYGPHAFNAKSGAFVIGVRPLLIAFNVNLDTDQQQTASKLAGIIRESGIERDVSGESNRMFGKLKGIQAIGVTVSRADRHFTQVSTNILDFEQSNNIQHVYELVKQTAQNQFDVRVTGSEIIGLIPLKSILLAGEYYSPNNQNPEDIIRTAIRKLGLEDLGEFRPQEKILEQAIKKIAQT